MAGAGGDRRAEAQAALEQQAFELSQAGLPANTPVRVLWRVRPSGKRSLHLALGHTGAWGTRALTLLDCLLGGVRV